MVNGLGIIAVDMHPAGTKRISPLHASNLPDAPSAYCVLASFTFLYRLFPDVPRHIDHDDARIASKEQCDLEVRGTLVL